MIRDLALFLIQAYRKLISPFLGENCRFSPPCSAYAEEAIAKKGAFGGLWMGGKRILKCHPFHSGGYDPVE